jgi:hypothetical protein
MVKEYKKMLSNVSKSISIFKKIGIPIFTLNSLKDLPLVAFYNIYGRKEGVLLV